MNNLQKEKPKFEAEVEALQTEKKTKFRNRIRSEAFRKNKIPKSKRRDLQKKKIQGRIRSEAYKKNKIPKSNSKQKEIPKSKVQKNLKRRKNPRSNETMARKIRANFSCHCLINMLKKQ